MSAVATRKRTRQNAAEDDEVTKRKRSATAETNGDMDTAVTADRQATRDAEFWLEDGTVIICARDVEFRVYKGVLATHSPVFKELFSQTHPTRTVSIDVAQQITCPVVKVDDSPEDLRHILRAYMPRTDTNFLDSKNPSFNLISASIRLGHKYDIAPLVKHALEFLRYYYTDDYDTWMEVSEYVPDGWDAIESVGVVNLARLSGESSILPTALLGCSQLGPDVVHGFRREDGTLETLTSDDLGLCFQARTGIREASLKAMLEVLAPVVAPTCKGPAACQNVLRDAIVDLRMHVDSLMNGDPFSSFEECVKDRTLAVCGACLAAVRDRRVVEHKKMWNRLPEIVGVTVPGWGSPAVQAQNASS